MTAPSSTGLKLPPGAIRIGLALFVLASLIGFVALFLITQDVRGSLQGFGQFQLVWVIPALALAAADWAGGGLRLWILTRPLGARIAYPACVQTSAATAALAYLTPSGTGGGPAQLYGLVRNGSSLGRAVAVNFASVTVNLVFLSLAGFAAWFFGAADSIAGITLPVADIDAATLFKWCVAGFGVIAAVVLLLALSPDLPRRITVRLFGTGPRVRAVLRFFQELHGAIQIYGARGKSALVLATLANIVPFGARFAMGWVVLRGFGIDAGFWNVVTLHVMLHFLLYFMPTPGGSGIAEVLAPAVMSSFMPASLLVAYTAVWRFFLAYVTIMAGGVILFRWLEADGRRLLGSTAADPVPTGGRQVADLSPGSEPEPGPEFDSEARRVR